MVNPAIVFDRFVERFGSADGVRMFRAPGRVNLIGEHTDYNDGFVLPVAIDLDTVIAGRARTDTVITAISMNKQEEGSFDLAHPTPIEKGYWLNYLEGTARMLQKKGFRIGGADLVLLSDIPGGAGLSSSASIEIATATALVLLAHQPMDRKPMALAAQEGEHEFTGAMIGIMDQFISAMGEEGSALLIDCRSLETRLVPVDTRTHALIVCDTGVKHDLATSEYNKRRAECNEAVERLQTFLPTITALRDVSVQDLERYGTELPDVLFHRARHVVTENIRTLLAAEALKEGNFDEMGSLMEASHRSLRYDYEVSAPELDFLVEMGRTIPGVYGSRMTGGGFGGSAISFVNRERVEEFSARITNSYQSHFGRDLTIYDVKIGQGAQEIADWSSPIAYSAARL